MNRTDELTRRLDALEGTADESRPRAMLVIPDNHRGPTPRRHRSGAEVHAYDVVTGACAFLGRDGTRCPADHRTGAVAPTVPAPEDDDVGNHPPTEEQLREWEAARNG